MSEKALVVHTFNDVLLWRRPAQALHALVEKSFLVPVRNPHIVPVLNRDYESGTKDPYL